MTARTPGPGELEPIERASRDELQALQLARLQWSVKHAYGNVPHYRRSFEAAGVHPSDLKTLGDLATFPFAVKQDFRNNYPFGLFAVPRDQVLRIHTSGGTTGKPTVVGYSRKDIDTWAGLMARSIRAAGGRAGDIVHVAFGYGLYTGGLGVHYGAERLGCTVIPVSGGQTERQVQLIQDFEPNVIMATPSYMLTILEQFVRLGLDPAETSLKIGIFGAEPWTEAMRGDIESRAGIDALDLYGLSEIMGPGVAVECIESKDGPVLWEDHFYPEIIDPETGAVLADGEEGELVITSLTKEALPVIRYRTRDLTRLLPPTSRSMRRMGKITGRSDDMLIIRGVNVFPSQIEEQILKQKELAPHYQIEITRDGHLDQLEVIVELNQTTGDDVGPARRQTMAGQLQHNIKSYVGISARVTLTKPGILSRSAGRAMRVVDKRSRPIGELPLTAV